MAARKHIAPADAMATMPIACAIELDFGVGMVLGVIRFLMYILCDMFSCFMPKY